MIRNVCWFKYSDNKGLQQQALRSEVINNTNNTYTTTHNVQPVMSSDLMDEQMPNQPPDPPSPPAATPKIFKDTYTQTDVIPTKAIVSRSVS